MLRVSLAARLSCAALVLAAVGIVAGPALGASGHHAHRAGTSVTVTATEFKFVLSKKVVPHGATTFKVVNKGRLPHDFEISGKKTALIMPGKSATLKVTLKAGKLAYKCTVAGHAQAGMKGILTVK